MAHVVTQAEKGEVTMDAAKTIGIVRKIVGVLTEEELDALEAMLSNKALDPVTHLRLAIQLVRMSEPK